MPVVIRQETVEQRPKVVNTYSYKCDNCGFGSPNEMDFIPIQIRAGWPYEEGFSATDKIYCQVCIAPRLKQIIDMGWANHYHGSTNIIEDVNCPGYKRMEDCPILQGERDPGFFT